MQVLNYADEVRPFSEVPVGDAVVKEPELKLAVQLIEQIATDEFHPENYVDEVRARYHEAIQRKVEGQEISAPVAEAPKGQIIDLMEALKASLAQKGAKPTAVPAPAEGKPARKAPRAAAAEARAESRSLRVPKAAAGGKRR
jgi:DNA end-binding protein Ku